MSVFVCLDCNRCLSADIIWWFRMNAFFCPPCNQTPAWPLLTERFSATLWEQWRLIWKLDSRVAVQKAPCSGVWVILNRPSESTDLFFCQTNNRFHFCCYLGDNYASAFFLLASFWALSIFRPLSLFFLHLLYCVSRRSTALACFELFSGSLRLGGFGAFGEKKSKMPCLICHRIELFHMS